MASTSASPAPTPSSTLSPTTPTTTNTRKRSRRKVSEDNGAPGEMPAWRLHQSAAEKEEQTRESLENFLFSRQKKLAGNKTMEARELLKRKGLLLPDGLASLPVGGRERPAGMPTIIPTPLKIPKPSLTPTSTSTTPRPKPSSRTTSTSSRTPTTPSTPTHIPTPPKPPTRPSEVPDIKAFLFWRQGAMVQNIMAGKGGAPPFGQAPFPLAVPGALLIERTGDGFAGEDRREMEEEGGGKRRRGSVEGDEKGDQGINEEGNGVKMKEADARTKALREMQERKGSTEREIREGVGQN